MVIQNNTINLYLGWIKKQFTIPDAVYLKNILHFCKAINTIKELNVNIADSPLHT